MWGVKGPGHKPIHELFAFGGRFGYLMADPSTNTETLEMDVPLVGPRPRFVPCRCCGRSIKTASTGRLPVICSSRCKQIEFRKTHPAPKRPRVSLEVRVARQVMAMLIEAKVVAAPMPPRREAEQR